MAHATEQAGRALREARLEAGLTQAQVARRLGVNPSYVANLEAGRGKPTIGRLAEVAEVLGVELRVGAERERALGPRSRPNRRGLDRRDELLDAVCEHILEHGVIGFSLRAAAASAGTTHRMLTYHFDSAPELVRLALLRIRARRGERAVAEAVPGATPLFMAWRSMIADEAAGKALLEGLGMAAADPAHYGAIAQESIEQYLPLVTLFLPTDWSDERRERGATLILAMLRGLMLDYLATRDVERLDQAVRLWDELTTASGWNPAAAGSTSVAA